MKMAPRRPLLVVYTLMPMLLATSAIHKDKTAKVEESSKVKGLRGQRQEPNAQQYVKSSGSWFADNPQVQTISGHYFGLHFSDSPFATNPWVSAKPSRVVDDLDPVAPYDRLDRTMIRSWSGAAQVEPGKTSADIGYTQPDFVPPYLHPKPFPRENPTTPGDGIMIPLEDAVVVAHEDRLRNPGLDHALLNPLGMYPLVAPADRIKPGPWAVAHLDSVPSHYDKFFDQTMLKDAARMKRQQLEKDFKRVDTDSDNAISHTEFKADVEGRQKKTGDQSEVLWNQYHPDKKQPDMTKEEFLKMAATGFDLGRRFVKRANISATLVPPGGIDKGFWGGGAACGNKSFVTGVAIKVKPITPDGDNTALNSVKFKCDDGKEIKTAEGPDGEWTKLAQCPKGQKIFSVSVRTQAYKVGQDNSGINDLRFQCRTAGGENTTTLMFGPKPPPQEEQTGYVFVNGEYIKKSETDIDDSKVVVGIGKVANAGGWSEELSCGSNGALCGAQGRLNFVEGDKDNIGYSDFRFFCCTKPVDCSAPCAEPESTDCRACKAQDLARPTPRPQAM